MVATRTASRPAPAAGPALHWLEVYSTLRQAPAFPESLVPLYPIAGEYLVGPASRGFAITPGCPVRVLWHHPGADRYTQQDEVGAIKHRLEAYGYDVSTHGPAGAEYLVVHGRVGG
jgi:hypothetical protein